MCMKRAVYPGSFDPFTNGHLDVVQRSIRLVDELHIAVLRNSSKRGLIAPEQRAELISQVMEEDKILKPFRENIHIDIFDGLLADYCRKINSEIVIRGLRAVADYEYEHAVFLVNQNLYPELETIFLMSKSENSFISSTIVKEVASFGGDVSSQVPPAVQRKLHQIYHK